MSRQSIQAFRDNHPYEIPRTTRTFPTAQGGCVDCGHSTWDYPGGSWCPCEDCHMGGLFTPNVVLPTTVTPKPRRALTA